jgi:serine/threonine protein kinase
MGEVYRGRDTRLDRDVAIKVLPDGLAADPERIARFEREAKTLAALNHPNIAHIYGVEESDGVRGLVMELVEGPTLAERLVKGGVPLDRFLRIAIPVTDAIVAAHQKGITHRDLKPANIIIGEDASEGRVKVLDFGLAKLTEAPVAVGGASALPTAVITGEGRILGTVAYMSPEQAEGKALDARSDLFSLGVIFYEMVTGQRPFTGDTSLSILSSIMKDTPKSVTELNPGLPRDLARIIRRALVKDPERRYQTAKDLRNDLEDLKASLESGELVMAAVTGPTEVSQHRESLRWWSALGIGIAGVAIAGGLFVLTHGRTNVGPVSIAPSSSIPDYQITQLTTTGHAERPAISPDGKLVAYVQHDGDSYSLWIRQTTTTSNVEIVRPEPGVRIFDPTFTPDGSFVEFVRAQARQFELWRVPFLGGPPKRVLDQVDSAVGWSLDGRQFAFLRADPSHSTYTLMVSDAIGGHERPVVTRRRPNRFTTLLAGSTPSIRPAWSPDGHVIAVSGAGQAVFVDVSTGSEQVVKPPQGMALINLAWLDAATLVAVTLDASGSAQLWQLSFTDGHWSRMTNDLNSYLSVSVTADRASLVTTRSETGGGVWLGDGAATSFKEAIPSIPNANSGPTGGGIAWAGTSLLWATVMDGRNVIARSAGRALEEVVANAITPNATSDAQTIVFTSMLPEPSVWKVHADGRGAIKLADGGCPALTPNGRSVLFISNTSNQSPWTVSIDGGSPTQITEFYAGLCSLAISPNGQSIAFWSQDDQDRRILRVCSLPTCGTPHTLPATPSQGWIRWTPDGRGIAYLDPSASNIWVQPVNGEPSRPLTHFTDGLTLGGFAWSNDGQQLAVARSTTANDVVLFKGLKR